MKRREPCFDNVLKMLRREKTARPVLFEFFLNARLNRALLGNRFDEGQNPRAYARNAIGAFAAAGYDYAVFAGGWLFSFARKTRERAQTVSLNDNWGSKTQPMLLPADMRAYMFPWHRRIVELAHAKGRPAVLHSCGQLELLMDGIIDDLKFDGKHSCEDTICSVEEAYRRWGRRIAILGGMDVDFMVRAEPQAIYERAKRMLEAASTGYGLGTGNSVPEHIPDDHYFAMTRAALERG